MHMPEPEPTEAETIKAAKTKLRALKGPIVIALEEYQKGTTEDPSFDPRLKATANVLNSLDIISDTLTSRIDRDPDYRGLLTAAMAYVDPKNEFHLNTPTIFRRQSIGLNYANIARSDPAIAQGLDLITKRINHAEEADAEAGVKMKDLPDRVERGITQIGDMPVSLERKR
jgi:hypothetical protein